MNELNRMEGPVKYATPDKCKHEYFVRVNGVLKCARCDIHYNTIVEDEEEKEIEFNKQILNAAELIHGHAKDLLDCSRTREQRKETRKCIEELIYTLNKKYYEYKEVQ